MENADVDMDNLISLVEQRPVIWDKTRDTYKDRNETRNAWKEIFLELRPDFEELETTEKNSFGRKVMKKWTNVRDAFKKSTKKQKSASRSGAGASTIKTYIYNEQLKFLNKVLSERETENSLAANTAQPDTSDEEEQTVENLQETIIAEDNVVNTKVTKKVAPKKRKMDHVELEMIKALKETNEKPDRHLFFFKGIIPSLNSFDEEDILEFQTTVLKTITSIKQRKKMIPYSKHIAQTQVNFSQQPITTTRSNLYLNMDNSYPNITHSYPNTSLALQKSQQTFSSMPNNPVDTLQPVRSTSNEHPIRQYYEAVGEDVSPFSVESHSSQESIDFSYENMFMSNNKK